MHVITNTLSYQLIFKIQQDIPHVNLSQMKSIQKFGVFQLLSFLKSDNVINIIKLLELSFLKRGSTIHIIKNILKIFLYL